MEFLSGGDDQISAIMNAAQDLGGEEIQLLFDRKTYCDLFNRYPFCENSIYRLRAAKIPDWRERHFRDANEPEKLVAFGVLKGFLCNQVPERIANFRIVRSAATEGMAALCNSFGEISDLRDAEYFDVASKITFRSRCLRLGNYHWTGPDRLVRPFVDYWIGVEN